MKNPSELYATPEALLAEKNLARAEKIELLERWRFDENRREVAEAEGMHGDAPDVLQRVEAALRVLRSET